MMIIGLTGGIGSGKSTTADLFAQHAVPVIDTDIIAREIVEPGKPALSSLVAHFGEDICLNDGSLDRARLKQHILEDDTERQYLESVLHPVIRSTVEQRIRQLDSCYCIVVIPLLVETGSYSMLDRILVVDIPVDEQIRRTRQRDSMDEATIEAIIALQADREQRLEHAADIIDNSRDLAQLENDVSRLHEKYMAICGQYS